MQTSAVHESQTPLLQKHEPRSVLCENKYFLDGFVIALMVGYALNADITEQ